MTQQAWLRKLWWLLGWFFVALTVYFSLTPSLPALAERIWDKASHCVGYAALMLWFAQLYTKLIDKGRVAIALVGLGVGLELLQSFGTARHAETLDALANSLGVACGLLLSATSLGAVLRFLERRFNH